MPNNPARLVRFWHELKRRKVLPFLIGYVAACFAIIEFLDITSNRFSIPDSTFNLLFILSAVGLPLAVILPWYIYRKHSADGENELPGMRLQPRMDTSDRPDNSVIVLPFENLSSDPDQEYFSVGLTEEIITDLSYIDDLLVISRGSAMTFKGTNKTRKEITNAVNVRYALEGSVRKAGENIRIVAQLIDGTNDAHIWADKYNGTLEDIFDIQEKVSRSIAEALKIKLSSQERKMIDQRPIDNAFAYDCYKRAYPEISSMSKERIDYGLSLLMKGLEKAEKNAVIYAGIASAYMQYANNGFDAEKNLVEAEEYIHKALQLDPDLPEAHIALGGIKILKEGDAHSAIYHWRRANLSNPDDPETMIYLPLLYALVGQNETAFKLVDKVEMIDPINPMCDAVRGWVYFFSGKYELAIDPLFAAFKLTPESAMHQFFKALILLYNDRANEAYSFINDVVDESSSNVWTLLSIFIKHTIEKDKEGISSLLTPEFEAQVQRDLQYSFHLAAFYSYLGEKDKAIKWLGNAVDRGFINYPLISEQDFFLDNIRKEKSFKTLMKRVKKEWEDFEVKNI